MAESEQAAIRSELKKLNKADIIELIVTKELPEGSTSAGLRNFVSGLCKSKDVFKNSDVNNDLLTDVKVCCDNPLCSKIRMDLEIAQSKVIHFNKLLHHLEKRIEDQELVIQLLKEKQENWGKLSSYPIPPGSSSDNTGNSSQQVKEMLPTVPIRSNELSVSVTKTRSRSTSDASISNGIHLPKDQNGRNHQNSPPITFDGTRATSRSAPAAGVPAQHGSTAPPKLSPVSIGEVKEAVRQAQSSVLRKYHAPTRKPVIGNYQNSTVKSVPKKGYLHVYRIDPSVSENDLTDCLKTTAPHINFSCIKIKQNEVSSSFKVEFPIEYAQEVYKPELWPQGSAVRRYIFPKKKENENFPESASRLPNQEMK